MTNAHYTPEAKKFMELVRTRKGYHTATTLGAALYSSKVYKTRYKGGPKSLAAMISFFLRGERGPPENMGYVIQEVLKDKEITQAWNSMKKVEKSINPSDLLLETAETYLNRIKKYASQLPDIPSRLTLISKLEKFVTDIETNKSNSFQSNIS